jgi:hypothetical protein
MQGEGVVSFQRKECAMPVTRRTFGKQVGLGVAMTAIPAVGSLALATPVQAAASAVGGAPDAGSYAQRAVAAYQAMQRAFYVPSEQLYIDPYPHTGGNAYSYVWPFSQAMVATLDLAGLPGIGDQFAADIQARLAGLAHYWNPAPLSHNPPSPPSSPPGYASYVLPPLGQGGDLFYDDNDWIALAFAQQYQMTGDAAALHQVETLYQLVLYAWDSDGAHPCPGGNYWTQASWSHDRNTISNAPGAQVALRLFLATPDPSQVAAAKQRYDWVNTCLRAPNGLYWDHIDLAGTINKTLWSYNQGVMIGAAVLLAQVTGDQGYLQQAELLAGTALTFYGQGGRLFTQDVIFNAIFFKNLLMLDAVRPDGRYRAALRAYTDALASAVDPATGLLSLQPYTGIPLLNQAAYIQLNALLAWPRSNYQHLA